MIDLERFRCGDRAYLDELVKTRGRLVLSVARSHTKDFDQVEDLFHEIWLHVIKKRRWYSGHGSFDAWLHKLATNVCISDLRARKARQRAYNRMAQDGWSEEAGWGGQDPLAELESERLHRDLHRALAKLPGREHQAILLRIRGDKTPGEIARIMGIKKATVRSLIRHGVNRLKKLMEVQESDLSRYQSSG